MCALSWLFRYPALKSLASQRRSGGEALILDVESPTDVFMYAKDCGGVVKHDHGVGREHIEVRRKLMRKMRTRWLSLGGLLVLTTSDWFKGDFRGYYGRLGKQYILSDRRKT
jgi:hypothetical protein